MNYNIALIKGDGIGPEIVDGAGAILNKIGEKYGKTAAQVILRWDLQKGVPTIARSSNKERSRQNFDIFDFTLSCEDMAAIAAMETGVSVFYSHEDPVTVEKYAIGMLKK